MRVADFAWLTLLAAAYTLLNAVKPLIVDDAAYFNYADQIAKHPFDPYGFSIFWYDEMEPANYVLAPPVLHPGGPLASDFSATTLPCGRYGSSPLPCSWSEHSSCWRDGLPADWNGPW